MKFTETDNLAAKDPFWTKTLSTLEQEAQTHRPADDALLDSVMQRVAQHEETLSRTIIISTSPFSRRYASIMALVACALFMIGYGINTQTQHPPITLTQQTEPLENKVTNKVITIDYPISFNSPRTLTEGAQQPAEPNVVVIQNGVINYPANFSTPTKIVTGV